MTNNTDLDIWVELAQIMTSNGYDNFVDARILEDEIERRGLQETYVEYLVAFAISTRSDWGTHSAWAILRATPEQRARAFLEAIKVPA